MIIKCISKKCNIKHCDRRYGILLDHMKSKYGPKLDMCVINRIQYEMNKHGYLKWHCGLNPNNTTHYIEVK